MVFYHNKPLISHLHLHPQGSGAVGLLPNVCASGDALADSSNLSTPSIHLLHGLPQSPSSLRQCTHYSPSIHPSCQQADRRPGATTTHQTRATLSTSFSSTETKVNHNFPIPTRATFNLLLQITIFNDYRSQTSTSIEKLQLFHYSADITARLSCLFHTRCVLLVPASTPSLHLLHTALVSRP